MSCLARDYLILSCCSGFPGDPLSRKPRLFYHENAFDCWIPYPGDIDLVTGTFSDHDNGTDRTEPIEVRFRWYIMSDKEFEKLPRAS